MFFLIFSLPVFLYFTSFLISGLFIFISTSFIIIFILCQFLIFLFFTSFYISVFSSFFFYQFFIIFIFHYYWYPLQLLDVSIRWECSYVSYYRDFWDNTFLSKWAVHSSTATWVLPIMSGIPKASCKAERLLEIVKSALITKFSAWYIFPICPVSSWYFLIFISFIFTMLLSQGTTRFIMVALVHKCYIRAITLYEWHLLILSYWR